MELLRLYYTIDSFLEEYVVYFTLTNFCHGMNLCRKYAKQYEKIINAAIHDGGEINAALVVEE